MRQIEESGLGIALVVDEGLRLIGTMTDGDVRRALLAGANIDTPILAFIQRRFTSVGPKAGRAEVLDLMRALGLSHVPILDQEGRLVGLHSLRGLLGGATLTTPAVLLAGGLGARLQPLTARVPKPMLKVAGRPILERLVLHLVGAGIQEIYLSVNYLANVIEDHFGDGEQHGCKIQYLREEEPLGTGGPLSLLPKLPCEPVLVMNGDLVTEVNVHELLRFHAEGEFTATLGVRPYLHQVPFGCVQIQDGCVVRLEEKPTLTQSINTGIYVISPKLLPRVPRRFFPITRLLEQCVENGERVGAFPLENEWIDVGISDQLREAREGGHGV